MAPGQGYRECVRSAQVSERRGQEARPGELHLQRLHLKNNGMFRNLTLSLSLRVKWERTGGPGPGTSCMLTSLPQGAAVRPSSSALPHYTSGRFSFYPDCPRPVSPLSCWCPNCDLVSTGPKHTHRVQRKISSLSQCVLCSSISARAGLRWTSSCPSPILSIS